MPLTRPKAAQVDFDVTNISDPLLRFNSGQTGSNDKDAGFVVERGDDINVAFMWDESADQFVAVTTTETGTTGGNANITAYANLRTNDVYSNKLVLTGAHSSDSATIFAENSSTLTTFVLQVTDDAQAGNQDNIELRHGSWSGSSVTPQYLSMAKFKRSNSSPYKAEIDLNGAVTINEAYTLPSADGTNGQALTTDGSGNLSFSSVSSGYNELTSDGYGTLTLTSTVDDATAGPIIEFYRNSATPADADYIGQLKFQGENDAGQKVVYGKITAKIDDASDTTEDGIFEVTHRKAGSNNISARWTSDTLKLINGTGLEVDTNITTEGGDALFRNSSGGSILSIISDTSSNSIIKMGDTADFDIGQIVYNNSNNSMIFHVNDADAMTIGSDGTVTASIFSGTATQAQYADLAEMYTSDEKYSPGTVLIFGGEQEVTTTTIMADHRVAGVVSTNPAHLMNSDCEGVALALRGRVPCYVDGPVGKGDIIVTGPKPGTGVALTKDSALPNAVCVVGKAIEENKDSGVKLVEVVV